uniref:Developmentally regulated GTP binding protein 2 n=1 Tax=Eptatretus burgeri TaxID=7764 RepID=A0A8C4N464_EPTBU
MVGTSELPGFLIGTWFNIRSMTELTEHHPGGVLLFTGPCWRKSSKLLASVLTNPNHTSTSSKKREAALPSTQRCLLPCVRKSCANSSCMSTKSSTPRYCCVKIVRPTTSSTSLLGTVFIFPAFTCEMKLNLDFLLEVIWDYLALIRVYTKKRGERPDFEGGLILRRAATVEHVCHTIHRTLVSQFKYCLVWGTSTKYSPQRVGLNHRMEHDDVIQVVKK